MAVGFFLGLWEAMTVGRSKAKAGFEGWCWGGLGATLGYGRLRL